MTRQKTIILIALAVLSAGFVLSLEVLAEKMFNTRLFRPNIYDFRVSGAVIDNETGKTVPSAHVIIETWTAQVKSVNRCYGLKSLTPLRPGLLWPQVIFWEGSRYKHPLRVAQRPYGLSAPA
jgi:hypothetical protein